MIKFTNVNSENRICVTTDRVEYAGQDAIEMEFPDNFDFTKQDEYIIESGELVHLPKEVPITQRIVDLKNNLSETDYVVTKIAESMVTGETMSISDADRYAEIIENRKAWRAEINELEAQIPTDEGGGTDDSI